MTDSDPSTDLVNLGEETKDGRENCVDTALLIAISAILMKSEHIRSDKTSCSPRSRRPLDGPLRCTPTSARSARSNVYTSQKNSGVRQPDCVVSFIREV